MGLIWKALVIWKHQVAETAARHVTERKNNTLTLPDGASPTDLCFLGTRSEMKSEAESRREKQHSQKQKVQCQWVKERQSECHKRQRTYSNMEDKM